jgi:hypothetical protein
MQIWNLSYANLEFILCKFGILSCKYALKPQIEITILVLAQEFKSHFKSISS